MKSTAIPFKKVPTLNELRAGYPSLKALFFDMDGTLFNTEGIHTEAMLMIADKYKIRPPHSATAVHDLMMGKADHLVFEIIKSWEGVPTHWKAENFIEEKNANVINILRNVARESYFLPEMLSLLNEARENNFYIALVTSSEKVVTQALLEIADLQTYFDLILTRDDCPSHKPDPWPYHKAQEVSGVAKFETLIFEDSSVGLEAAITSGSHVIKVEWY
jgi:beta-phosphoglucomutase